MEIRYSKAATKAIRGMDKATKKRIHEGILGLTEKPPKGDIKVMLRWRAAPPCGEVSSDL